MIILMTCENLCIVLIVAEQRHKALQEYEPDSKIIQLFYVSKECSMNTISSQLIKFVSQSTMKVEFELTDFCYALSNYFVKLAKSRLNRNLARNPKEFHYVENASSILFKF